MYAVSIDQIEASPFKMKFQNWWIYNLENCHPYWIEKIKKQYEDSLFLGSNPWDALMRAYDISLFSPLKRLRVFAEDYHQHFPNKVSKRQIDKVFDHFYHLGIDKVGHLKKIPYSQVQNRFGKEWAFFFKGILSSDSQAWPWINHSNCTALHSRLDLDYALCSHTQVLEPVLFQLESWSRQHSSLFFSEIELSFVAFDSESDQKLEIEFPQKTSLQKDLSWIRKILEERLLNLELQSPISEVDIRLQLSPQKASVQLSLFQDKASAIQLEDLYQKLNAQGFVLFIPESTPSSIPEKSWQKTKPSWNFEFDGNTYYRPLLQHKPRPRPKPEGRLYLTERIEWTNENGEHQRRDYYLTRGFRQWIWMFQDQTGRWFEQGVLE